MPTYEYTCKSCNERLEVRQGFTDDALTECPACGGTLRKVFGSVGIAFKGSGFYKTDSRGSSSASSTTSTSAGSSDGGSNGSSDSSSNSSSTGTKSDSSTTSSSSTSSTSTPAPSS